MPNSGAPSRFWAFALAAAIIGALAFAAIAAGDQAARQSPPLADALDRLAERAGFGVEQVDLTGHRMTSPDQIFAALNLAAVRSVPCFDSHAARLRVEALPWVHTAAVSRAWPDRLSVTITERTPIAVWQGTGEHWLIDAGGRLLGTVPASSHRDLPRVAGEGAPAATAALLRLIARYPELERSLGTAVHVAERRWTLELDGGRVVHLPTERESQALELLFLPAPGGRLIDRSVAVLDLRSLDRVSVRTASSPAAALAAGQRPKLSRLARAE